jgi:hypothetical protein
MKILNNGPTFLLNPIARARIVPVTNGMTLTASWVTRGTSYSTIANTIAASVRVDATISNTDSGILMESGATGTGSILYVYAGVLYFQCGNGSAFGPSPSRAEISYTLPAATIKPIIEWSADTSNAVLYINGEEVGSQTFSEVDVSGGDSGTIGQVSNSIAVNRGGWTSNGQGSYTNTIELCRIFNGQVTPDV